MHSVEPGFVASVPAAILDIIHLFCCTSAFYINIFAELIKFSLTLIPPKLKPLVYEKAQARRQRRQKE
jgi:hypothetical protein